jgi:hypothetical protein
MYIDNNPIEGNRETIWLHATIMNAMEGQLGVVTGCRIRIIMV